MFIGLLATVSPGCDSPIDADDEDQHTIGLLVLQGEQEVARIDTQATPVVTGRIQIPTNTSRTFQVVALGDDGEEIPITGEEYGLAVAVSDANIAMAAVGGTDQLVVSGRASGSTELELTLLHGGHPDFSRAIPLVID